jgi:predicted phosphodiesterase
MKILVISDIHANLAALEAVLVDAGQYDAAWCLGDLVGYGPDPNECIACVRKLPNLLCVIGNHDSAVMGQIDSNAFNSEARRAIEWTRKNLTSSARGFLGSLPERIATDAGYLDLPRQITLVHGSPRQPVWEYLLDTYTATTNFEYFDTDYCFVGHTHLPIIFHHIDGRSPARPLIPEAGDQVNLSPRAIINPGSVGQPRDRNPQAAYALFMPIDDVVEYRRVSYDIAGVQNRMRSLGLPERHIVRLEGGW